MFNMKFVQPFKKQQLLFVTFFQTHKVYYNQKLKRLHKDSQEQLIQGPYSRNDDPRSRMREVLAVSF